MRFRRSRGRPGWRGEPVDDAGDRLARQAYRAACWTTVLGIVAVILVIAGVFAIIRKQVIWGAVLIVIGLLVGPGGVSIFT